MPPPRRSSRTSGFSFPALLSVLSAWGSAAHAQARVPAAYATPDQAGANVDSCAVWAAPDPADSLLFATEKDGDRIEVFHASTGAPYSPRPYLGGAVDGSGPGEFNRPNGVWVLYHVPYAAGFADVLLVTDQLNQRVQGIRLPELEYFGELGAGEVGKGYGIAWYQDGTDIFVFITDQTPPAAHPGKIKKYRLRPDGALLGADLVFGVGSSAGSPPLPNVESIVADFPLDRLHVCGDEGGKFNRIFRLDGTYTGITYGDPQFEFDQEGINLYDLGGSRGYLLVSDQHTDGTPNEFELFDRSSLASLGNFRSAPGAIVTTNTDGAYLEQRPVGRFPNGAFFAVNDDRSVHAYDWTDMAQAMGLEITALDRPFAGADPGALLPGGASRPALWFHDGSWWGALVRGSRLTVSRLEDGTFSALCEIGPAAPAETWASGDELVILSAEAAPRLLRFGYDASLRRYEASGDPLLAGGARGPQAALAVEADAEGRPARGWVAWTEAGSLRVTWGGPAGGAPLSAWDAGGALLGSALDALPRLARLDGAVAAVWIAPDGVSLRLHLDASPPGDWTAREVLHAPAPESIAVAAAADGALLAAGAGPEGASWAGARSRAGAWAEEALAGTAQDPALVLDDAAGRLHMFHTVDVAGRRLLHHRDAALEGSAAPSFGPSQLLSGWPRVTLGSPLFPARLPLDAQDLVAAALGDDALGRFGRLDLSRSGDLEGPITLQHTPTPGASGVARGSTISFRITDDRAGVDRAALKLLVNGQAVAPAVRGAPRNLIASYKLPGGLAGPAARIRIEARDLAAPPHLMAPFEYDLFLAGTSPRFRRGDANQDGAIDVSDAVRILLSLFGGGSALECASAADTTDDSRTDVSDAVFLLRYLFLAGDPPPPPGAACGEDATPDGLPCGGSGCN